MEFKIVITESDLIIDGHLSAHPDDLDSDDFEDEYGNIPPYAYETFMRDWETERTEKNLIKLYSRIFKDSKFVCIGADFVHDEKGLNPSVEFYFEI